jgi:bcr-type benzoyl-CoA reductase subunit C
LDTNVKSEVLQEFSDATNTIVNPAMKEWKDKGGKIVGYFCCNMADEMITAAGMLPFRMRATGSTGTELSDAFYSSINCSFPRHAFNMALNKEYTFLDGLIVPNSCDHVRRIYDNWVRQLDTGFVEMFNLPRKVLEPQVMWYKDELLILKEKMEKHFGIQITEDKVIDAIKLHNETRRLLKQLYELRQGDNPPVTGAQVLAVVVASTCMPRDRFNEMLKELMEELKGVEGTKDYRARLMVVGGILDDPEYLEIIEDTGGLVVTDSLCFGTRCMWVEISEDGDPFEAIARYQIQQRPTCPRSYGDQEKRAKHIQDMIKDFKVDGVIGERLMFCDPWVVEHYMNRLDLKEIDVPFLKLDREYILSGRGQLRTRIQAFLEMMGR